MVTIKNIHEKMAKMTWIYNVPVFYIRETFDQLEIAIEFPPNPVIYPKITYEKMHQRLMHASTERMLKACSDADIKISYNEALGYHCPDCHLSKSKTMVSYAHLAPVVCLLVEITIDSIEHKPLFKKGYR